MVKRQCVIYSKNVKIKEKKRKERKERKRMKIVIALATMITLASTLPAEEPVAGLYVGVMGSMIYSTDFEPTIGAGVLVGYDTGYLGYSDNLDLGLQFEGRMTIQNYSNVSTYSSITGWYVDSTVARTDLIVKPYLDIFYLIGGVSIAELPIIEGEDEVGYYQTEYEDISMVFGAGVQKDNIFVDLIYRELTGELGLTVGYTLKF